MPERGHHDWSDLLALTRGEAFVVERVRLANGVAIEGRFAPPDLAQLAADEVVFITAFIRSHGSIKDMERLFGVSYPTIKNRLNRLASRLPLVEVASPATPPPPPAGAGARMAEVLAALERGEITAREAIERVRP